MIRKEKEARADDTLHATAEKASLTAFFNAQMDAFFIIRMT